MLEFSLFVFRPKKHKSRGLFKNHKRNTRASLTPGTIVILLTGVHKGKRAVLLKTLDTGLLLITGPFILNAIPLRRVHQGHVIATKTKLDISSVQIPEEVDDKYFKRTLLKKKPKKNESKSLFVQKPKVIVFHIVNYHNLFLFWIVNFKLIFFRHTDLLKKGSLIKS